MNNSPASTKKNQKIWLVSLILGLLAIAAIATLVYLSSQPKDLGNRLKYVGSENYGGCLLFWCETKGGTTYYFATDMDEAALKSYFPKASYDERQNNEQTSTDKHYSKRGHAFKLTSTNQLFVIEFYSDPTNIKKSVKLQESSNPYLISIDKEYYNLAKSAL